MVCLPLLFLLTTWTCVVHGQATVCPRISDQPGCVCQHPNGVINLTQIANIGSPRFTNLGALGFHYYFNPCHIYFDVRCSDNVYICQAENINPSNTFTTANGSEQIIIDPSDWRGQMYLRYTGPGSRITRVYLHCNPSQTTPVATASGEPERLLNYVFDLYSCAACPGGCVVDCGTLNVPANGQVSHTAGAAIGQTATYSCDTGYLLMGDSTRTCQATGVWSGSAPTCIPNSSQGMQPQNAWYRIVHRQSNRALDGNGTFYTDSNNRSIHLVNWNDGPYQRWRFNRINDNYYTIINNGTGEYLDGGSDDTGAVFSRRRVYLHVHGGGVYQQWIFVHVNWPWFSLEQRATGEVLDGAGNETYMLPYNEGNLEQFREYQQWRLVLTEDINECTEGTHDCHPQATCNNTQGSFTCSCNTGYTGNGSSCTVVDCDTLISPANGQVTHPAGTTFGQTAFYSCDAGYNLVGESTRTCQTDEMWSGSEPTCQDNNECNIANGGCEHNCTKTIEGFHCSCDKGYHLDRNRFNCSDIDECASDVLNNCHENANCTNTEGSFNCSCNPGYTGDGVICTSLSSGVQILPAVLAPTVVLITLTALLCVAICVVCKIRRQEPTMFEIHKMFFKNDMVDLTYNPVSPSWTRVSKRLRLSSVVSMFEKLGTIQGTGTHQTVTNNDSNTEILAGDPATSTLTNNSTTTTAIVFSENDTTVDSFAASTTTEQECYDPSEPQNTPDVLPMDQILVTEMNVSNTPPSYPIKDSEDLQINLDLGEDVHNFSNEACTQNGKIEAELSFNGHDCSDDCADGHTSAIELPTHDCIDTAACNSIEQSTEYVSTEDLLRSRSLSLNRLNQNLNLTRSL